jgi:hypothetical protein
MLVIRIRKQCAQVSETWIWLSRLRAMSVLFHSCSLRNVEFQTTWHFSVINDNSLRNKPVLFSVTWVLANTLDFPSLIHTIYLLTYVLPYSLTPWKKLFLEKLTDSHLVKKFPAFYGTGRFITAFSNSRHLSQSWARSIQSVPPHIISWRSILILSSHLRLGLPSCLLAFSVQIISVLPRVVLRRYAC